MNKAELIDALSKKTDLTKKATEETLNAFVEIVSEELKKGEKVQLIGFGTFETKERVAKIGRNPQTGREIRIPASKAPAFKAGKALS